MAVIDYEAAWHALSAEIASKTQHGREGLLTRMAELAEAHRLPAGQLPMLLRLYGVEVARAEAIAAEHDRDEDVAATVDSIRRGGLPAPATMTERGHDGRRSTGPAGHAAGTSRDAA